MERKYLEIHLENGSRFYYNEDKLELVKEELEKFLEWDKSMDSLSFAKKMMFSHELKANNLVEGYSDDLELIEAIVAKKTARIQDDEVRKRINNLYKGYQYILDHRIMDERHLHELYTILSKDLLSNYDLTHMGKLYRGAPVYILQNGRIDMELEEAIDYENIEQLIAEYFDFIHAPFIGSTKTDEYIKSQIMHFYFVYIHPYFDVNGRTSRTMAMWYLMLKKAYPFIIFNRGISFKGTKYDATIRKAKERKDLTLFLEMMLDTLKIELEKEKIMQDVASSTSFKMGSIDYQTILYFLTMNGLRTCLDFVVFYNHFNDHKKPSEIYHEMLEPLIDAGIFNCIRQTKGEIASIPNQVLELNPLLYDYNPNYLKRVKLK